MPLFRTSAKYVLLFTVAVLSVSVHSATAPASADATATVASSVNASAMATVSRRVPVLGSKNFVPHGSG
jgi:hypothetical protein